MKKVNVVNKLIDSVCHYRANEIERGNYISYKSPFSKEITDKSNIYCSIILCAVNFENEQIEIVGDLITPDNDVNLVSTDIVELSFYGQKALYVVRQKEELVLDFIGTFKGTDKKYYEFLSSIPEMSVKCQTKI